MSSGLGVHPNEKWNDVRNVVLEYLGQHTLSIVLASTSKQVAES